MIWNADTAQPGNMKPRIIWKDAASSKTNGKGIKNKREGQDLTIRMHKLIFWRQVTRTLKVMHANNKDSVNNNTNNIISQQGYKEKYTGTRVSQPNPQGQGEAQSVSDWETCPRGR